jgi:hypothetical protein
MSEEQLMAEKEWIAERELAERLGVPVDRVRELRSDVFAKKEGRRILISPEGVKSISEALADESAVGSLVLEKKGAGEELGDEGDEYFEVVTKKIPMNPRLVLGEWLGQPVRVRVPDSKKFVPGMRMKCRLVEGDVMALVGRGPRFKGKW